MHLIYVHIVGSDLTMEYPMGCKTESSLSKYFGKQEQAISDTLSNNEYGENDEIWSLIELGDLNEGMGMDQGVLPSNMVPCNHRCRDKIK
jgi:hypothetical protein